MVVLRSPTIQSTDLSTAFASDLTRRLERAYDSTLLNELQIQINCLPLQASSAVVAKQDELDERGTELWNHATRLRRDESDPKCTSKEDAALQARVLCLLRAFSFLLLDTAGKHTTKGRQGKSCVRLMTVALKAAKVCIGNNELSTATKILERAAEYQETLAGEEEGKIQRESEPAHRLRAEYYVVRTALVSSSTSNCMGIIMTQVG